MTYLLLANIFLAICYGFYYFFLRRETFFRWNRIYLLTGLVLAFMLPVVETTAIVAYTEIYHIYLPAIQVGEAATVTDPVETASLRARITVFEVLRYGYWLGCAISFCLFVIKLSHTIRVVRGKNNEKNYSFFGYICIDQGLAGYEKIEAHEHVHVREWHSLDILLVQVVKIFNWFNPVIYLYERALKLQHEYIADRETASEQPLVYAQLLVSTAMGVSRPVLTNQFADASFLKSRIRMLLKDKSSKATLFRFAFMLPLAGLMLIVSQAYNQPWNREYDVIEEDVHAFRTEEDSNKPHPNSDIENHALGNVVVAYQKNDGTMENIRVLNEIGHGVEDAVETALQTESITGLAPSGKNSSTINVRINGVENADTKLSDEKTSGHGNKEEVLILGYSSVKKDPSQRSDPLFTAVEVAPEPQGGLHAFRQWIGENYRFPEEAQDKGVNGIVQVSFVIEHDGSLTDIKVNRDLGYGTGEEAVRVLQNSAKWSPGIQNGRPVAVAYTLPIRLGTQ